MFIQLYCIIKTNYRCLNMLKLKDNIKLLVHCIWTLQSQTK
jgi:hypothetical protein